MNDDRKDKDIQNLMYPVNMQPNVSVPGGMNPMAQQVILNSNLINLGTLLHTHNVRTPSSNSVTCIIYSCLKQTPHILNTKQCIGYPRTH